MIAPLLEALRAAQAGLDAGDAVAALARLSAAGVDDRRLLATLSEGERQEMRAAIDATLQAAEAARGAAFARLSEGAVGKRAEQRYRGVR